MRETVRGWHHQRAKWHREYDKEGAAPCSCGACAKGSAHREASGSLGKLRDATFLDSEMCISTDFSAQYDHKAFCTRTCEHPSRSNIWQGSSHGRALQLQSSPMRFVTPHIAQGSRTGRVRRACRALAHERVPEARWHKVNVLSPIQRRSSWNYPGVL